MGELIRSRDWQDTELGPPAQWPVTLKTSVSTVLNSGTPMLIAWGDDLLQFYNDGYIPILTGSKHPAALGCKVKDSFPEIWGDFLWPLVDRVLTTGEPIAMENARIMLDRDGDLLESYFTFSYSPIKSLAGKVCGVASVALETTDEVIIKRRERGLLQLNEQLAAATTHGELRQAVRDHVEGNRSDLPFLLWYDRGDPPGSWRLVEACGVSTDAPIRRQLDGHDDASILGQAIDSNTPVARLVSLPEPVTDWLLDPPPALAVQTLAIEPLCYVNYSTPDAYLVFGISAQLPFDGSYKNFLESICRCIEQAVRRISAADIAQRENLRQFDEVTAVVPSLVWKADASGACTFVSRPWLDFTGLGSSDSLGDGWMRGIHPADRADVETARRTAFAGCHPLNVVYRLRRADGQYRWMMDQGLPRYDEHGDFLGMVGSALDITERKEAESVLRDTSDRLALATKSARIGIWDWDVPANTLLFDAQMLQLYGLESGKFAEAYEAWVQLLHPDDRERVQSEISDALAGRGEYRTRFRIIRGDGQVRDIEANGLVQRAADGTALRMIGANRDITDQMQADRHIRYLNRVHAMTSSVNALIVHAGNREDLFQQACRIAVGVGGFQVAMIGVVAPGGLDYVAFDGTKDDAVRDVRAVMASRGAVPSPLAARAMRDKVACVSNASQLDPEVVARELHVRHGVHSMAILPLLSDGASVGVMVLYAAENDFFQAQEIKLLTELSDDVALAAGHLDKRDRLAFLARYDPLTGLANRSLFLERVGQHLRTAESAGEQVAVLMFDLERFKNINDGLGRDAGDQLLRQVADWLTGHLGDASLLARIYADRYGIVIPAGRGSGEIAHVIESMMASFLGASFDVNGESLRIAARAGVAIYPTDGEDAEALFKCAEAALKKAGASSARHLFYTQKMTDAVSARLALESQLRNALENEEFVLHYQPKVDLASGKLSGAEALIRWNNPRTGLMPPGLFIPILEETGMINEVGSWALQQAISDWLRWRRDGLRAVPIAVNVSPLQLRDPAFISQLGRATSVAQGAAQGLALEITESMIMDDVKQSIATLKVIRDMGISVAIDDFGTGFSSLGYLAKLPIDTLKIDRMFIVDMVASAEGLSLVSTMLTLARSLKLGVVAEGVETAEQASLLRSLECDEIQGYLVSPPLACAQFEARFLADAWRMH